MCQRATGAPVVPWLTVTREAFAWSKGEPAVYRSSQNAERLFCASCGTQLAFRAIAEPDHLDVTLASLDDPEAVRPSHHIWTASRIGWFDTADDPAALPGERAGRLGLIENALRAGRDAVVADSQVALGTTSAGQVLIALLEIEAGLRRRNGHEAPSRRWLPLRYRLSVEPRSADYCHCRMCRRAAGAPVVARLTVASAAFAWTKGEPAVYRSSAEAERLFCPAGAPVRASSPSSPLGLSGDAAWRQCVTMDLIGSACCRYLGLEGVSLAGGSNERALAR
jgi:hypothetical protein